MTLYELLNTFQPCTDLKINIISPRMVEVNEKLTNTTIYSHCLLDDICESTLQKIKVEFMSLYSGGVAHLPYIKVFISAETESALIPLIKRLNVKFVKEHE